jgi:hypothetical protein
VKAGRVTGGNVRSSFAPQMTLDGELPGVDMEQGNLKRNPQSVQANGSYLFKQCSADEVADYDAGFNAGSKGLEIDGTKSLAWRTGWSEAQEYGLHFSWSA